MVPVYIFWLGLVILFGIAEAATLGLTSIWFAVGALAAMIAALCKASLLVQIILFVVVSGLALYITRGWGQKKFNENRKPTNADRILGQRGQVLEDIDNHQATGVVKVDGKIWTARSVKDQLIPAGSEVIIRSIEGVKVMVTPVE
ncbi:MAG: NfeD family protein [Clostridia bacterium]|nr:NfeD family protein [Clostridia bacterium]